MNENESEVMYYLMKLIVATSLIWGVVYCATPADNYTILWWLILLIFM